MRSCGGEAEAEKEETNKETYVQHAQHERRARTAVVGGVSCARQSERGARHVDIVQR